MDVVDVDLDPLAEQARRRSTLLRIGLPLGGVGLIIGVLLGIALYADSANRAGVLGLSDTLLHGLQERVALQVSAYLEPASRAALLAHSMLGRGGATDRAGDAQVFAASVLDETPQVANVLFADGLGNFMLVRRALGGPPGGTDTKRILAPSTGRPPGERTVEWTTRNAAGTVTARHLDPGDDYDARTRAWFTGARAIDEVFWTGVYIFASERLPGITTAVHGPGAKLDATGPDAASSLAPGPDVVGIDIKLDAISGFLGGLQIGRTGRAYLVSKAGEMVAGPDPGRILRNRDGQVVPARVEEVGDAALSGSWDHFRVQGAGTRVIEVGGQRLISIVTPLGDAQGWLLVIAVPEAEFSGFVTVNSRRAGVLSLVVVALALGLAALLVRQGLRADRADRAVAERSQAVRLQSAAFARLAAAAGQFAPDGTLPPALVETLAEATGARRAGVWRLLGAGQVLRCEDSFEPATAGHVAGVELSRQEVPALIEALGLGETIDVPDARRDRRTAALHGLLMAPLGSTSLLAVPVLRYSAGPRTVPGMNLVLGMVLLEDARGDPAAHDLAQACAALVSLRLPDEMTAPVVVSGPTALAPTATPGDGAGLDASLLPPAPNGRVAPGQAHASVLVLHLPEAAMAGAGTVLAHQAADAAQRIAAAHGIPYVKMLGATVVAATGYAAPDAAGPAHGRDAAARLADAAIALREACAGLFEAGDDPAGFRIGLDAGSVLGGAMGTSPELFNLWGEAFSGAEGLAGSAPSGAIQASEQAYRLLREAFLFRPRGLFYRPGTGETHSYVLAGRA